jgi:hypothetical protein
MTGRYAKVVRAASLLGGGLALTAASVNTAVTFCIGVSHHNVCGATMIASAVLITGGFAADGSTRVLDGTAGTVVHAGMAVGIVSFLSIIILGPRNITDADTAAFGISDIIIGFAGIVGLAAAGIGLAVGAVAKAYRSPAGMSSRNRHGNRSRMPLHGTHRAR